MFARFAGAAAVAAVAAAVASAHASDISKYDARMAVSDGVVTNGFKWIDGRRLPVEGRAFGDVEHWYDRLPAGVTTNVNGGVRSMKHHTSGMQFRFSTDSKSLAFKWVPYNADLSMDHMPSTGVSGIDVYRFDVKSGRWLYATTGRIWDAKKGGSLKIAWTPGEACIVNLPLYNGVREFSLGIDPDAEVRPLGPRKSGIDKPVVFYGTSITHGGCASRPGLSFVNILGRDLDVPVVNLGFSGSGVMEYEMSEHLARIDASCYVLDCLWNMDIGKRGGRRNVDANYEPFIRNLRRLRPGVPIVMAEQCDVFRGGSNGKDGYIRGLHEKLVAEGWGNLVYLPKDAMYSSDGEGTVDGCHPNDLGMESMAKAYGAAVSKALCLKGGASASDLFCEGEFFVGCNYWAKNAGMYMWSQWDRGTVEKELAALAANGVTVMRVFPLWSDFQPLTGDCHAGGKYRSFRFRDNRDLPNPEGVDPVMMSRFRDFCDIAAKNDIRLIVGIVTGWMSGRQFVPPVFENRNVLSDPEAVMWQTRFVKRFVREMKDHRAIAAWDFGNECNCMGAMGEGKQAMFYNWMDHIGMAIRSEDATRPVVSGMHGLSTNDGAAQPIRLNGELSDILCTHPYSFYVPGCGREAFNTMRTELHPTAESLLYRDLGGKPCFIEEVGNLGTSCTSDERTAAGMRATLFSAWANDLKGCLWWCNSDQEVLEFPPYTLTPCERELGMLRQDLSPKPVMLEMKAFQEFRRSLPFAKLPKAKTDAVIVVPEKEDGWIPGFGAYLLARQAGINPSFTGAERELPESGFYIVCSAATDGAFTYPAQKRLYEKAAKGTTVLLLYSGESRFTRLREHAGVRIDYCTRSPCDRTFELSAHPGRKMNAWDGTTCRLLGGEAEVLGRAADGEPVFTRFTRGKGAMLVCNAPIDRQTVGRTDVLTGEAIQSYYLVLREAARIAGVKHVVEKGDCPFVGITEHPAADGRTIVIAINFEPREIVCPMKVNGALGRVWRGSVKAGSIILPPNEAAVFEVVAR